MTDHNRRQNDEKKPEYFRAHEEEDREHFKKIQTAIDRLPCKEELDEAVKGAVELHVNGKIRGVQATLDQYIKDDMEWKKTANPAVTSYQRTSAFFSFLGDGTRFLIPLLGLIGIIYGFFTWIKT